MEDDTTTCIPPSKNSGIPAFDICAVGIHDGRMQGVVGGEGVAEPNSQMSELTTPLPRSTRQQLHQLRAEHQALLESHQQLQSDCQQQQLDFLESQGRHNEMQDQQEELTADHDNLINECAKKTIELEPVKATINGMSQPEETVDKI